MGSGHEAVQIQTGFSQCTLNCVYSQTIFINTKFCGHSNRLACFSSVQLINLQDAVPNKSFYLPGYASIMANLTCVHILHMTRKVYVMPPSSCGKWRFMGSSSGSAVSCLQPPQQQWKQKHITVCLIIQQCTVSSHYCSFHQLCSFSFFPLARGNLWVRVVFNGLLCVSN